MSGPREISTVLRRLCSDAFFAWPEEAVKSESLSVNSDVVPMTKVCDEPVLPHGRESSTSLRAPGRMQCLYPGSA